MSETFVTFMGLGIITTVQFFIIVGCLDRLEKKIDKLKEHEDGKNNT